MAKDPSYIRNFRAIARADPTFEHLEALEKELYSSNSDRATVVMSGSFVEASLERLLLSKMRNDLNGADKQKLFEYEGAAGTFSSKIILAYAFNVIGKHTRHDLDIIRLLRNEVAHSKMPFNFKAPEVRAVCDQFRIVEVSGSTIPHGYVRRAAACGKQEEASDINDPKTRFVATCHSIAYRMIVAKEGPRAGDIVFPGDPVP